MAGRINICQSWHRLCCFKPSLTGHRVDRSTFAQCCAGPLVIEDDSVGPVAQPRCHFSDDAPPTPLDISRETAGICNGLQPECSRWQSAGGAESEHGVRTHAQLRLNRCQVDYNRLKSTAVQGGGGSGAAAARGKEIRRLMRAMYGAPDQDYEDWQIVVLSDMDSGAHCCGCGLLIDGAAASVLCAFDVDLACTHFVRGWARLR